MRVELVHVANELVHERKYRNTSFCCITVTVLV